MAVSPAYIEPAALFALMEGDRSQVCIVDVRDDDRTNWIVGSVAFPSLSHSPAGWTAVAGKVGSSPIVVFHCMFSQVRGPKAAKYFANMTGLPPTVKQVLILKGGFVGFRHVVGAHHPETLDHPPREGDGDDGW